MTFLEAGAYHRPCSRAEQPEQAPMRTPRTATVRRVALLGAALAAFAVGGVAQQRNINFELLAAARAGSEATVRALLDQGASPDSRNRLGDTALNIAARDGNAALARLLVERGADVNLPNLARVTPLMSAAFGGHAEIVKLLLARKANVKPTDRVQKT